MIIVIMGVSGCGKTSVAKKLAEADGMTYVEGDSLHPESNIDKMSRGIPLTEEDREPWLKIIRERIDKATEDNENLVVTCSALSRQSRSILGTDRPEVQLVFLEGTSQTILKRLEQRTDHYMPPELLDSQFAALEVPTDDEALIVSIEGSLDIVVARVVAKLK